MAITIAKVQSTPNRLVYTVTGDGSATAATIASATLIADAAVGPLKRALSASYANQAAMRAVFGEGKVRFVLQQRDSNANMASGGIDVDVDAVTAARPEVNLDFAAAPGSTKVAYLHIEFMASPIR